MPPCRPSDSATSASRFACRYSVRVVATTPASDRKSTRLNSSHRCISYAVFCLEKKHDLTHSFDVRGRLILYTIHATAVDGRLRKGRDLHARRWRLER